MALAKLKILAETAPGQFTQEIAAQFNPEQITIEKTVNWNDKPTAERDVPESQFTHGNASSFTVDLLFDSYEEGTDVRRRTEQVLRLTKVEGHGNIHRPPICKLSWGRLGEFFKGVLISVTQRFTLFLEDGTPVRAWLRCTFKEWQAVEEERKKQNLQSADVVKRRTVRKGDTLSGIAAEEYHDPGLWRPIARANRIRNPRLLEPGQLLLIPVLGPEGEAR